MHRSTAAAISFVLLIMASSCSFTNAQQPQSQQPPGFGDSSPNHVRATSCIPHERDALLAFKQGVTADPAGVLTSWQRGGSLDEQDCCRWRGVRCSNRTGHVLELLLSNANKQQQDSTAAAAAGLVGQISSSLLSLQHLEHLDLSWNSLQGSTGGRIPEHVGSLSSLKYLDLSGIPFSGPVPHHLGNLTKLQYLNISFTATSSTDLSWLTRLPFLEYLSLRSMNLSTIVDWPHVVNMISSLRVLDLTYCSLTSAKQQQPLPPLNLTNLEELHLSGNQFDHPIASCWFWNLTNIKHLIVEDAALYGQVPEALGAMAALQYLDLSHNAIEMPTTTLVHLCHLWYLDLQGCSLGSNVTEVIEGLPQCPSNRLEELYLGSGQLVGTLPNSMVHLTGLAVLDLSQNNITGPLPAFIGSFTSLRTLDLAFNHITGGVPHEIAGMSSLIKLDLSRNDLQGLITEEHFAGLNSLQYIDLSHNSLKIEMSSDWQHSFRLYHASFAACQMGPLFPGWLQWHVDLYYLDLSYTGITDTLPYWFSRAFPNLQYLYMSNNQLSGSLPTDMELMSLLEVLALSSNQLTGPIPPLPRNLTGLDLSMNSLFGPLPLDFGVPKLLHLFLFSNRFMGSIPEAICKCEQLMILNLANNFFKGEFPKCFGMTSITTLELSNNSLSGEFPTFLQNCTNLTLLDLGENIFSGSLPVWIGNFERLRLLRLSHNRFSGNIPTGITSLKCLQYLDISDNNVSGSLPRNFMDFTAMSQRKLPGLYTQFSCDYPGIVVYLGINLTENTKGHQFNYDPSVMIILMDMMSIDLSSNHLTGEVPEEIGTLVALSNLNLSRNHFSGNVPNRIGAMQSLESLDLSRNMLHGEIPTSLSNLAFLSYMDLSYNNLTGRIPSGSQLDTLYAANPSMYTGNIGLCGPPLENHCLSIDAPKHGQSTRTEEGTGLEFFYIGLGCGFVAGIWAVFFFLLFMKQWRIAYFRIFDALYDKTYVLVVVSWARRTRQRQATATY